MQIMDDVKPFSTLETTEKSARTNNDLTGYSMSSPNISLFCLCLLLHKMCLTTLVTVIGMPTDWLLCVSHHRNVSLFCFCLCAQAVSAAAAVTEESHHAWGGHFSKCPEDYKHYCIHGKCRWVKEQNAPSCW